MKQAGPPVINRLSFTRKCAQQKEAFHQIKHLDINPKFREGNFTVNTIV